MCQCHKNRVHRMIPLGSDLQTSLVQWGWWLGAALSLKATSSCIQNTWKSPFCALRSSTVAPVLLLSIHTAEFWPLKHFRISEDRKNIYMHIGTLTNIPMVNVTSEMDGHILRVKVTGFHLLHQGEIPDFRVSLNAVVASNGILDNNSYLNVSNNPEWNPTLYN